MRFQNGRSYTTAHTKQWLYILNIVATILFLPMHLFFIGLIFYSYVDTDWKIYTWSGIQIGLAVYSLIITFGNVALQIVMLYARQVVRILIFFYVSVSFTMLLASTMAVIVNQGSEARAASAWTLMYQALMNGPTLILLTPLYFFISDVEANILANYKELYNSVSLVSMVNDFIQT